MKTTIGGDRLGAGNKQEVSMKNYSRSTHDLGYVWRSTMSSGTLVPFMSEVALPGDSFDIDLQCDVKTLPTVGPLFGSYKVQLDIFECPIRLYNGKLHMNMLNIGMNMKEILLPQYELKAEYKTTNEDDNLQINPSSIYSYLNVRGLGRRIDGAGTAENGEVVREFNAVPLLAYWDVFKNYYANKQEDDAYVIHAENLDNDWELGLGDYDNPAGRGVADLVVTKNGTTTRYDIYDNAEDPDVDGSSQLYLEAYVRWDGTGEPYGEPLAGELKVEYDGNEYNLSDLFNIITVDEMTRNGSVYKIVGDQFKKTREDLEWEVASGQDNLGNTEGFGEGLPQLKKFALTNIDTMREDILKAVSDTTAFKIDSTTNAPYGLGLGNRS